MPIRSIQRAALPLFASVLVAIPMTALAQALPPALPPGLPPEAQNPAVQAAAQACAGDVQKFCPQVTPGGGRIIRCLIQNQAGVSEVCRSAILNAKAALGR